MYYYAGKPISTRRTMRAEGKQEIGETCGHMHGTIEAASKCVYKQKNPEAWGVYRGGRAAYSVAFPEKGDNTPDDIAISQAENKA